MDFSAVVSKLKHFLDEGVGAPAGPASCGGGRGQLKEVVYGRVCRTRGEEAPVALSSDLERKSVFLFGPDCVESILAEGSASGMLHSIGYDRDYFHHTVVEQKSTFWLILFTPDAPQDRDPLPIALATWDGVIQHVQTTFPDTLPDLLHHLHSLKEKRFEDFEEEAGFEFLESKKNRHDKGGLDSPPYFSYKYFCSLPKPRSAWQVRAFLYCEVRLLKLFTGDGCTRNEGERGQRILEYLGPNVRISELDPSKCAVLKMNTHLPLAINL